MGICPSYRELVGGRWWVVVVNYPAPERLTTNHQPLTTPTLATNHQLSVPGRNLLWKRLESRRLSAHFCGESFDSVTARAEVPFLQDAAPCLAAVRSLPACSLSSCFRALRRRSLALGILRRWCRREPRRSTSVVSAMRWRPSPRRRRSSRATRACASAPEWRRSCSDAMPTRRNGSRRRSGSTRGIEARRSGWENCTIAPAG